MPERQSSTGEETARAATDGAAGPADGAPERSGGDPRGASDGLNGAATHGDGAVANGSVHGASANGAAANGAPTDGALSHGAAANGAGAPGDGSVPPPVADQVAEHVAAEPGAAEPAPAEPGEPRPDAGGPVVTGMAAAPPMPGGASLFEPPVRPVVETPADAAPASGASSASPAASSSAAPPPATTGPSDPGPASAPAASTPDASTPDARTGARDGSADAPSGPDGPTDRPGAEQPTTAQPVGGAAAPRLVKGAASGATARSAPPAPAPDTSTDAPTTALAAAAGVAAGAARAGSPGGDVDGPTRPTARADVARTDPTRAEAVPASARDESATVVAHPVGDAEATQVIRVSDVAAAAPAAAASAGAASVGAASAGTRTAVVDPPTERLAAVPPSARPPVGPGQGGDGTVPPPAPGGDGPRRPRRRRAPLLIGAAVVALLALLYVGDLLLTSGTVPRGTTVAGVDVGGLTLADAEQQLRARIEPRSTQPVPVTAGDVNSEIDPVAAGLAVDWNGTLAQAGDQPLNPITRIASFFTTSNVLGVVTTADDQALTTAVEQLGPVVNTEPVEGTVRFEGATPVAVDPVPGQQLDPPAAVQAIKADWASGVPVALPLISLPALTTAEDVATALEDVALPAVSGPVRVIGEEDTEGELTPEVIAQALSFEPVEGGGLEPVLNPTVVTDALEEQLAGSEQEPRDAELDFSTTPATVVPSQDGRGVDYEATLADLLSVLTGDGPREITAVYAAQPAELTTDELNGLGNAGEISTFTTRGFAQDSGINIRRAAELVDGTVVGPGETFSLDAVTGPRTAGNGYVEAGVIDNGRAGRGIAGGVSQVSTTTYNAAYFAGMTDIEHRPHSFYISRYPEGREATIVTGALDMRFRNDTPTAVLIRTAWTPSSITVTFYGTKYYDVTSSTGPRTNPTQPNTVNVPAGEPCNPSQGAPGFTVTDTRTLRNLQTGETTSETQTTRYNPAPIVVCGG